MTKTQATRAMMGTAIAAAVGTLLPWATIWIVTVNGIDADRGLATLVLAGGGLGLLFVKSAPWFIHTIAPLGILATLTWFVYDLSTIKLHVGIGNGVYVCGAAAGAWLGLALASRTAAVPAVPEPALAR